MPCVLIIAADQTLKLLIKADPSSTMLAPPGQGTNMHSTTGPLQGHFAVAP
jgi:hypothetical protein